MPAGSGLVNPAPSAQTRSSDQRALGETRQGAIFSMVGFLLTVIGTYLYNVYGGLAFGISCSGGTCTSVPTAAIGLLAGLFVVVLIGVVFGILAILRFRSAFQALVPIDYRFRSPASLSILAVIGSIFVLLGLGLALAGVSSVLGSCGSNYNYTSCYNAVTNNAGLILGALGALALGAILLLIGEIMVLIGIWRLGTRYNESLLKIGAIFVIIPFLDIVAPFLIYFGANQAQRMVEQTAGMTGTAPPFSVPPPGAG